MTAALGNTAQGTPFATGVDAFVYPQFLGTPLRAPTTQDIYNPGTRWQDNSVNPAVQYYTIGAGIWYELPNTSFGVSSVTGTANQILATPTVGAVVLSLIGPYTPATYTAHGVLIGEGTGSIVATTAGTAGQLLTSGGAGADPTWTTATFPLTAIAGSLIAATATNVIGQIADVATGQVLMSGGVGVIPAYSGSPSVSGSFTAATTITATNGNFVSSTAGKGLLFNATTASGAASGPVVLNSRAGKVTFTSVSIAAAADLTLTMTNSEITSSSSQVVYSMAGATTGSALSVKSVTPGSGTIAFVITNGTGATTTTADISITFLVVN